jgi:hypothetical protein
LQISTPQQAGDWLLSSTYTQESGKTLIHTEIVQANGDRVANEKKELDINSEISKYIN